MVKVIGITASPKTHGNTEKLLESFLRGAEKEGAETEKIKLKDLLYTSCQGCNKCHRTGRCVLNDDLKILLNRIVTEADVLVLASPIYSMTITAEMKAFIDRGQYMWARKFVLKNLSFDEEHLKTHKGVFVSTAGMNRKDVFDAAFPVVRAFFNDAGYEYTTNITAEGMDNFGTIEQRPDKLKEAEDAGREVVLSLKNAVKN
ncbi:flavodoxin family protein [Methanomicrobium antiquum]|uniref:Flavodoxin family protein n=1 Tax=Methanomicrobium antiquum TaxID=487686 RepID=A0AAF0JM78_9EURY|nr:flavodoxin family protein [Methanomicrobium antiquum]WFN36867.1 flavodoxin family protein [Methanomicrobium antiquum]